jgi:hypothetical protein
MGMVMIMRCTCDKCGKTEEPPGVLSKGWAYVNLTRIPGYTCKQALLCKDCVKPVLVATKLKLPLDPEEMKG